MEKRLLGRTGLRVTPLTLSCMMFGGRATSDESEAIIDRALAAGINFLDTANVYSRRPKLAQVHACAPGRVA